MYTHLGSVQASGEASDRLASAPRNAAAAPHWRLPLRLPSGAGNMGSPRDATQAAGGATVGFFGDGSSTACSPPPLAARHAVHGHGPPHHQRQAQHARRMNAPYRDDSSLI